MDVIQTATGKTYASDYFIDSGNDSYLYFRVLNISLISAISVFSNPSETSYLLYNNIRYDGPYKYVSSFLEKDAVKIILKRELLEE